MKRYELTDNKTYKKYKYTKLQWKIGFCLIFLAVLLTGLMIGYYWL